MPSKKKRYNARFPPARIKKIMQTDEDVGKVAAAVPVIISRALELFIESLILKANDTTQNRHAKTLSTAHIKQTIEAEKKFDFLRDLVAGIPDHQGEDEGETTQLAEAKKPKIPRQRKPKTEGAGPSRRGERKTSSDSSHLEVDEDDSETESDEETEENLKNAVAEENIALANTSAQDNDRLGNASAHENDFTGNTSSQDSFNRLRSTSGEDSDSGRRLSGLDNDRLKHPRGHGDSSLSVNNSCHAHSDTDTFMSPTHPLTSSPSQPGPAPLNAGCMVAPPFASCARPPPGLPYPMPHPAMGLPGFPQIPLPGMPSLPYPVPFFNHSTPGVMPAGIVPPPVFSSLQMSKAAPSEDDDYDA